MRRLLGGGGRSVSELWNPPVTRNKAVSSVAASSGPSKGYGICVRSMKLGATTIGTNFGAKTKDSAQMHPDGRELDAAAVTQQTSQSAVSQASQLAGLGNCRGGGLGDGACEFGNSRYSRFGNLRYEPAPFDNR